MNSQPIISEIIEAAAFTLRVSIVAIACTSALAFCVWTWAQLLQAASGWLA